MIERAHIANQQGGFTLVDVMLALMVFSMILLMGYQAIFSAAGARNRVAKNAELQADLRAAHRTLGNAVKSGALIKGGAQAVNFDLRHAHSDWLSGSRLLKFSLSVDGQLLATDDVQTTPSALLQSLPQARFEYHKAGLKYSQWQQDDVPDYLQLSWGEGGRNTVWRFAFQ